MVLLSSCMNLPICAQVALSICAENNEHLFIPVMYLAYYAYQLGRLECRRFGLIPFGLSLEGNLHHHWLEMVCCIALSLFGFLLHSLQYKLSMPTIVPNSHLKVLVVYCQQ